MRFLLFNVVVGVALLSLFGNGGLDLADIKNRIFPTQPAASSAAAATAKPVVVSANKGPDHARDVIGEPATMSPKPNPPKPPVKTPVKSPKKSAVDTPAPKLVEAGTVAPVPEPKQVPTAVDKRRAEVLGADAAHRPASRVALKQGTSMMTTAERRRDLDALVEEMEMLYLDETGG